MLHDASQTSVASSGDVILPAPIRQLLTALPRHEHFRFELLFTLSVQAMQALSDVDVSRMLSQSTGDLLQQTWDSMQPHVDRVCSRIRILLEKIRVLFPDHVDQDEVSAALDALDAAHARHGLRNPTGIRHRTDEADPSDVADAVRLIHGLRASMDDELSQFECYLHQNEYQCDKWFWMDHLEHFQIRMTASLGELIFLTARSFTDVRKSEVVPFYADDLEGAIVLRQSISLMRDNVMLLAQAMAKSQEHPFLLDCARHVLEEIEKFRTGAGYAPMRAADKRMLLRIRSELMEYLDDHVNDNDLLRKTMASFVTLLDLLRGVNMREVLKNNDEKTIHQVEHRLQAADVALAAYHMKEARSAFSGALRLLSRIRGKYAELDSVAHLLQRIDFNGCDAYEVDAGKHLMFTLLNACQHTTAQPVAFTMAATVEQ